MKSRMEEAMEKKSKGYNCAQAVACTYCDLLGLDEKIMFKMTEGLGLGMGNMEGTCGAVTGACILAGMAKSTANLDKPDSKALTMKISKEIMEQFKERNGAVICKELKGMDTGKVLRSCPDCVRDACELVEQFIVQQVEKSTV